MCIYAAFEYCVEIDRDTIGRNRFDYSYCQFDIEQTLRIDAFSRNKYHDVCEYCTDTLSSKCSEFFTSFLCVLYKYFAHLLFHLLVLCDSQANLGSIPIGNSGPSYFNM